MNIYAILMTIFFIIMIITIILIKNKSIKKKKEINSKFRIDEASEINGIETLPDRIDTLVQILEIYDLISKQMVSGEKEAIFSDYKPGIETTITMLNCPLKKETTEHLKLKGFYINKSIGKSIKMPHKNDNYIYPTIYKIKW